MQWGGGECIASYQAPRTTPWLLGAALLRGMPVHSLGMLVSPEHRRERYLCPLPPATCPLPVPCPLPAWCQVIARAKVPIVKFEDAESGYAFDVSFDVANGPEVGGRGWVGQQQQQQQLFLLPAPAVLGSCPPRPVACGAASLCCRPPPLPHLCLRRKAKAGGGRSRQGCTKPRVVAVTTRAQRSAAAAPAVAGRAACRH